MVKKSYYKQIMLEGFQSFGSKTVIKLDRLGLNIVTGPNGAGKSTIFNAIYWCEYGENLKDSVETWEDRRPDNYQGTRVVIERTDGVYDYRICRHLNYKGTTFGLKGGSKLMIFKKPVDTPKFSAEHLVGDALQKSDMQALIEEQIGVDANTFMNSIFFGQRAKSIIEAKPEDKRKLFEELFSLSFVEEAKERAKTKYREYEIEYTKKSSSLANAESVLESAKVTLAENEEVVANFATNKKKALAQCDAELEDLYAELAARGKAKSEAQDKLAKIDLKAYGETEESVESIRRELASANNGVNIEKINLTHALKEIEKSNKATMDFTQKLADVKTNCTYCGGKLKAENVKSVKDAIKADIAAEKEVRVVLDKKVAEIQQKISNYAQAVKDKDAEYEAQLNVLKELKDIKQRHYELTTEVASLSESIKLLTSTEAKVKERRADIEASEPLVELDKYRAIVKAKTEEITSAETELNALDNLMTKTDWWIKKGFGAGGLKSFVFNAMLNQLNIYTQKYADATGWRVEFSVDMSKASKPFQTLVYEGDRVRNYKDLSGGQKQRVDVCVAFAMHDLVAHKTDINILVMDEIFEGLDNAGIELAFGLIREKSKDKSVYLITHSDIIDSLGAKTLNIAADELGNTYLG